MGTYIELVKVAVTQSLASTFPAVQLLITGGSIGGVNILQNIALTPVKIIEGIFGSITTILNEIWAWLLYNFIAPLLVLIFLILFFVAQFYLIKFYIYIFKNGFTKLVTLFSKISTNKKFNQLVIDPIKSVFD